MLAVLWRSAKLVLLVLLASPFFGWASRCEAGFVLRQPQQPKPANLVQGLEALIGLDSPVVETASSAESGPASDREESTPARDSRLPLPLNPIFTHLQTSGASAPDSMPSGVGAGASLHLLLSQSSVACEIEASGKLFLVSDAWNLPPFPSRLFRPPRVVA
jgi:hypothetical protein